MSNMINDRYALIQNNCRCGGMAEVHKATDTMDGRTVAIKLFKNATIKNDEITIESFRRETQALGELRHQHIVSLLASGKDESTGHHFLVLEWMDDNLDTFLKANPCKDWNDFWQVIGYPILQALVFSHGRKIIHRDLSLSNILVDKQHQVKLADFGIAKIKSYFHPTITLNTFSRPPFTPPESDDGSYTYSRDVFSFGIVVLKCFLPKNNFSDYPTCESALKEFSALVPPPIASIIAQAISKEPANRQSNAEVLLTFFNNANEEIKRAQKSVPTKSIFIQLTKTAKEKLRNEGIAETQMEPLIKEDLNDCGISTLENKEGKLEEGKYSVFGSQFRYIVATDQVKKDCLVVIDIQRLSSAILEQNRGRSWRPSCFQFEVTRPINLLLAQENIRNFQLALNVFEEEFRQKKLAEERQRIFRDWKKHLDAKSAWEGEKEPTLRYTQVKLERNRAIFTLADIPEKDCTGQPRYVGKDKRIYLRGEVEEIKERQLTLYVTEKNEKIKVPPQGLLVYDSRAAEIALIRQKQALDTIHFDRAVSVELKQLLIEPEQATQPSQLSVEFIQSLDTSQEKVVLAALGTQDFFLIQGPPGTGKTTVITEIILQTLRAKPQTRILLSSQTHVALDNALERLKARSTDLKLVRLGEHERIAKSIHDLLLSEQLERWRKTALGTAENFLVIWANKQQLSPDEVTKTKRAVSLQKLKELLTYDETLRNEQAQIESLNSTNLPKPQVNAQRKEKRDFENEIKVNQQLIKQLADSLNIKGNQSNILTIDTEISQLLDLNNPAIGMLQRLIKIQTDWFEQFGRNERFHLPLLKRSQVVAGTCVGLSKEIQDIEFDLCIVDEVTKATATETLIPLSRAKRWILVGDPKQLPPFKDEASRDPNFLSKYELRPEDIETLFDYLWRRLPEPNKSTLKIQHRMAKPIGDLISTCFYEKQLESSKEQLDESLLTVMPKPVTWFSTTSVPSHYEQKVPKPDGEETYNNSCEAKVITDFLKRLNEVVTIDSQPYTVAILAGYSAQVTLINKYVSNEQEHLQKLTIGCNTVDAVQGREAKVVIYSVTRSNSEGNIGFLKDQARLNVALSRGRDGLVIVGDHLFCRKLPNDSPLHRVLDYIEKNHTTCALEVKS